jgi:tRNA threonylcarbamoyladenosine biosynthesis protein TsaB
MRILGVDTAGATASVALVEDDHLIAEESFDSAKSRAINCSVKPKGNHAEIILPLIQLILDRTRTSLTELTGIALSIGPGSFTGLRIALATVKGIAYDTGLPVAGISTLHANAARAMDTEGIICSLLDARKHEVYAALFHRRGKSLSRLSEDSVISVSSVIELLSNTAAANATVIGDGATAYENELRAALGAAIRLSSGDRSRSIAAQVAMLSLGRFVAGTSDDLGTLTPVYLRPSEAQSKRLLSILTC